MDDPRKDRYNHQKIEAKWQKVWAATSLDVADIRKKSLDSARDRGPFYNLMMFPYASAEGLHIGNMYAFTGSDIYGRFKRMQGYNVFEPIGLDGFGIHSENFALKIGRHPMDHAKITEKHFYDQLHRIGAMFDFSRTLETYDPSYYRWTQWLFVQMFKHGLAYRAKARVNFCPSCKTVLADERVIDEKCERCGNEVEKRALEQWFFRITAYAEKLLADIPKLQWSEIVKVAQTNWIGKKEGISITYPVVTEEGPPRLASGEAGKQIGEVSCFTTRPDTNFGATFVVLAPEHEFVASLLKIKDQRSKIKDNAIVEYIEKAKQKSDQERIAEGKKKTGVFTGLYCINQLNNTKMPLYISDFVLSGFGTGVVVGVPGHDKRDFQFAKAFALPIIEVVSNREKMAGDAGRGAPCE
ncbi:class I tRNA ligase family protein, partial [Patescibacteria group bacterium]|nr:class I tRNA ligase family protein [Patescibacteria group bacterium]